MNKHLFEETGSKSGIDKYCKYHFQLNHNGIACLVYELFRSKYAFVSNDISGVWYKNMETKWDTFPGIEYELRNLISDKVLDVVLYSGWKPRFTDDDSCDALRELEFMLGTHEDKLAIVKEMEARFFVLEVPVIKQPKPVQPTHSPPQSNSAKHEKKVTSKPSKWMGN